MHCVPLAEPLLVLSEGKLGFGHTLSEVCCSAASQESSVHSRQC